MAESTLLFPEYAHTYKPDLTDKRKRNICIPLWRVLIYDLIECHVLTHWPLGDAAVKLN